MNQQWISMQRVKFQGMAIRDMSIINCGKSQNEIKIDWIMQTEQILPALYIEKLTVAINLQQFVAY